MSFNASGTHSTGFARVRPVFAIAMLLAVASCTSTGVPEGETASASSATVNARPSAPMTAEEIEAQRLADLRKREEAEAAEEAKLQARRDRVKARREEAARIKAEEEQAIAAQREQEQREQQARRAAERELAAAEAEREAKIARISQLEAQITESENTSNEDEAKVLVLNEAVTVAEELLDALADEQVKYETTDESGNTVEPLAKDTLEQLEARKNELVGRVNSQ